MSSEEKKNAERDNKVAIVLISLFAIIFILIILSVEPEDMKIGIKVIDDGEIITFRTQDGHKIEPIYQNDSYYIPVTQLGSFLGHDIDISEDEQGNAVINFSEAEEVKSVSFNTTTLDGKLFSNDDLLPFDYCIFVVWADWCPDCERLFKGFAENQKIFEEEKIKLIGIPCIPSNMKMERYKEIVVAKQAEYGIEFENIVADKYIENVFMSNLGNIPAVYAVNKKGQILYELTNANKVVLDILEEIQDSISCGEC